MVGWLVGWLYMRKIGVTLTKDGEGGEYNIFIIMIYHDIPYTIHLWFYLPTPAICRCFWLMVNVGKYTNRPMDGMATDTFNGLFHRFNRKSWSHILRHQ